MPRKSLDGVRKTSDVLNLRHRLAVRHARETVLFPELAMATHWRAGENSPFSQLNPDLFKYILDFAV
jgi:hypothetical protein